MEAEMNPYEQAVRDCMIPTAKLLDQTENPRHRAILLNWWRHVHLEGSGQYDKIVAPDMTVEHPVYRVSSGDDRVVIDGREAVLTFYNSVWDASLWHSDDRMAVADWGLGFEITLHMLASGSILRGIGYDTDDPDGTYHLFSRQAYIWPYDERALLIGEHQYEDKSTVRIERVDPAQCPTPARMREVHREQGDALERERGAKFWMLNVG
jgi:hypothetical protein